MKIREVDFLGVVIRPEEIKIKKVKVKVVLNWPVSKSVMGRLKHEQFLFSFSFIF